MARQDAHQNPDPMLDPEVEQARRDAETEAWEQMQETAGPQDRSVYIQFTPVHNEVDPFRQYYLMRNKNPASDTIVFNGEQNQYTPYLRGDNQSIRFKKIFFGNADWMQAGEPIPMTYQEEISSDLNWSYLGYGAGEPGVSNSLFFSIEDGTNTDDERNLRAQWFAAAANPQPPENPNRAQNDNWATILNRELPRPFGSPENYNLPQALSSLAIGAMPHRLNMDAENELLRAIPMSSDNIGRQLKTAYGITKAAFLRIEGNENLRNAYQIQTRIDADDSLPLMRKQMAALAAYPEEEFLRQSRRKYLRYDFYDFKSKAPLVQDIINYRSSLFDETKTSEEASLKGGYVDPEYNYFQCEYETAVANPAMPEAALPNFYVYNFVGGAGRELNRPPWQEQDRAEQELQENYDKLITLGEFSSNMVPSLESEEFQNYLELYANAAGSADLTVDFVNSLKNYYGDLVTPASGADLFALLNQKKHRFPFYIEVGVPTKEQGPIGKYFQHNKLSNHMVNALVALEQQGRFENTRVNLRHAGFEVPSIYNAQNEGDDLEDEENPIGDPFIFDEQRPPQMGLGGLATQVLVFDFKTFFDEVAEPIQNERVAAALTLDPDREQPPLEAEARQYIEIIQDYITTQAKENMISYEQYCQGTATAKSETIVYQLVKFDTASGDTLQSFYFPNSSLANVIGYVDTQIKYDRLYTYELYAYDVVYGSSWDFRTRAASDFLLDDGSKIYYSFNVSATPQVKIVKYPLLAEVYATQNLYGKKLGGVSYPPVRVLDRPPIAPLADIVPYRDNFRQILVNLSPMTGKFTGDRALRYIPFSPDDSLIFSTISKNQKRTDNFSLKRGFVEFKNEGASEIDKMEIYRTTVMDSNVESYELLYRNFENMRIKTLDINPGEDVPENQKARAFDFIDTLEPNVTYYYTFRCLDRHNQPSNPTTIYEVELVYDKGTYLPQIQEYHPVLQKRGVATKRLTRFLEIRGADIQTIDYAKYDTDGSYLGSQIGLIRDSDDQIKNNTFIVRLTSKDTGKKIQFRLNFEERIKRETPPDQREGCAIRDSQEP